MWLLKSMKQHIFVKELKKNNLNQINVVKKLWSQKGHKSHSPW